MGEREVMPAARIWGLGRGSRFAEISRFLEKDKQRKPDYDDDIDIVSLGGRSVVVGRYATGGQILSGYLGSLSDLRSCACLRCIQCLLADSLLESDSETSHT